MPGRHRTPYRPTAARLVAAAGATTVAALALQPMAAMASPGDPPSDPLLPATSTLDASTGVSALAAAGVLPKFPTSAFMNMAGLDAASPYQGQLSCDPVAKPGVQKFANLMLTTFRTGHSAGVVRECYGGEQSEHKEGRAWDWMLSANDPGQKALGDAVVAWLVAPDSHGRVGAVARRFGIEYIIWNRRMWRAYRPAAGWLPYSGVSPHTDHIHFSFGWDGAMGRTTWWTGKVVAVQDVGVCQVYAGQPAPLYTGPRTTPCPTSLPAPPRTSFPVTYQGQTGANVAKAQKALGITADGQFGPGTLAAVIAYQKARRLPVTGVLDNATWARLLPTAAPVPSTPTPPTPTTPAPITSPSAQTLAATTSISPYYSYVLSPGGRGASVAAMQRALGITADGAFGPVTESTLKAFQTKMGLRATGVTDRATWLALEKVAHPLKAFRLWVLKPGGHGYGVQVLQRALKLTADGAFGPVTTAAVKAAQQRAGIAQTGVVATLTWIAVEKQAYPLGVRRW